MMELNLGTSIRRLRTERGMTQEELAAFAGVSFQAVSKWECGTTTPDIALLPKLAVFFGVRIDDLFGITDEDELERVDYLLGHERITEENFDYSKNVLDRALEHSPDDVRVLKTYARLYFAKNQRDRLEAGRMLRQAMTTAPADDEIWLLYHQFCGKELDDFIRTCEPYLPMVPVTSRLYELLIAAMIERRYSDRAESLITAYEPHCSTAMPSVFRGDLALAGGDTGKALAIWDSVDAGDHKAQYELGERLVKINEHVRAVTAFGRSFAAADIPRDLSAMYSLAFLHERLGNRAEA
ncbi:MAG: helix-turn-helix domain-containing protein, partial [Clostridia bacterium]|nr:helix-turn-helix domain-containing protein [Clostridia bacterium]